MDNEQDKILFHTIRVRLYRNEQGKIEWKPDPNGAWNIVNPNHNASGLYRYFEPVYPMAFDNYGLPFPVGCMLKGRTGPIYGIDKEKLNKMDPAGYAVLSEEKPILGVIHIRKRRTGAKAAFEEAQRMAKYYGGQLISETREPYVDHYQREIRRNPLFPTPTRWQRLKLWFSRLFTPKGKK